MKRIPALIPLILLCWIEIVVGRLRGEAPSPEMRLRRAQEDEKKNKEEKEKKNNKKEETLTPSFSPTLSPTFFPSSLPTESPVTAPETLLSSPDDEEDSPTVTEGIPEAAASLDFCIAAEKGLSFVSPHQQWISLVMEIKSNSTQNTDVLGALVDVSLDEHLLEEAILPQCEKKALVSPYPVGVHVRNSQNIGECESSAAICFERTLDIVWFFDQGEKDMRETTSELLETFHAPTGVELVAREQQVDFQQSESKDLSPLFYVFGVIGALAIIFGLLVSWTRRHGNKKYNHRDLVTMPSRDTQPSLDNDAASEHSSYLCSMASSNVADLIIHEEEEEEKASAEFLSHTEDLSPTSKDGSDEPNQAEDSYVVENVEVAKEVAAAKQAARVPQVGATKSSEEWLEKSVEVTTEGPANEVAITATGNGLLKTPEKVKAAVNKSPSQVVKGLSFLPDNDGSIEIATRSSQKRSKESGGDDHPVAFVRPTSTGSTGEELRELYQNIFQD